MKVLVAEDDLTSRHILSAVLGKWGYEVIAVSDGLQAWERMQEPDAAKLAVLDWVMPGLDGVEVCRRIRQRTNPEPPYLILLTAREEKKDIVLGLEAGANDYIAKPYDRDELRARIAVGRRVVDLQEALVRQVSELQLAITHIKTLQGILPICMHCHKIRTDRESWDRIETYICDHSEAKFSHGICPDCLEKFYPEVAEYRREQQVLKAEAARKAQEIEDTQQPEKADAAKPSEPPPEAVAGA